MQKIVLHKANTRGHASHGWLDTYHTFSFADYYDASRVHFGALRVLNDDYIAPGMGFGMHPHDNMEIITIPLEGAIEHKDSMGNTAVIRKGDIQVMSAGSGIYHSEFNHNQDQPLTLLQIWIHTKEYDVEPRYDQISLNLADRHNRFQQILSPNKEDEGVWIYQDAWFHIGQFDSGFEIEYQLKNALNGVYAFVISGDAIINGQELYHRDGMGISGIEKLSIQSKAPNTELLLMEVPIRH